MKGIADENFRTSILRGVQAQAPEFDFARAQDIDEISGRGDLPLLAWATRNDRVLLTRDLSTMIPAMREQLRRAPELPIGTAI